MDNALDAAMQEFLAEAEEIIERVTLHLAAFERGDINAEAVHASYRDIHSLKGGAHLFGCKGIGSLAHGMEAVLEPVRAGKMAVTPPLVDALLSCFDAVRRQVANLKAMGREDAEESDVFTKIPELINTTLNLLGRPNAILRDDPPLVTSKVEDFLRGKVSESAESSSNHHLRARETKNAPSSQAVVVTRPEAVVAPKVLSDLAVTDRVAGGRREEASMVESAQVQNLNDNELQRRSKEPARQDAGPESVRVAVGLLDKLMNLIGELVLIRNQVLQFTNVRGLDAGFGNLSQRLSAVTTELQNEVMKTRMQPIGNVVSKFHRVVRDMARDLGKSVDLELSGVETELDKTLIEAIKDPLTHIVRNSVDHGIEKPAERKASGKPEVGRLVVRSFHEGGQVVIEISDDGKGLSVQKIGRKAVEKGLLSQEALDRLSDREVQQLIFAPGFSTAEQVTNFSGRGVGMDVVRTNIEKIGGIVDLNSVEGRGTTIRLKIPLTLAIIPALVVRAGGERFAIPQIKLVELVRACRDEKGIHGVELLQGRPVYRLRGKLLPLVNLSGELSMVRSDQHEAMGEFTNIVVLDADRGYFGLVVDEIVDSSDIVVKPLASFLKSLSVYSGATVLGDGGVVLSLDVMGLAAKAGVLDGSVMAEVTSSGKATALHASDSTDYLTVEIGQSSRYAVPLCLVNRLEEFKRSDVEFTGGQPVVRYRGSILPLLDVAAILQLGRDGETLNGDVVSVFVVEKSGRMYGLVVNVVRDVLTVQIDVDSSVSDRPGILGGLLWKDEVVVVMDVFAIIDAYLGTPEENKAEVRTLSDRGRYHLLVVDDSPFFRRHVSKVLEGAGFRVTTASDGEEGLACLRNSPTSFALVVSDIEMPKMTGLELARSVKKSDSLRKVPMVALTTKFMANDQAAGSEAGFVKYLEKLNADQLLREVDQILLQQAA